MNTNKTRKEIEELQAKISPLQQRMYELENEETLNIQRPRLSKMVGYCLRSTYEKSKSYYGRILDLIETKEGTPYFVIEICHITEEGNPYLHLDSVSPYLNKEWWDTEVPMSGWERCSESEYQTFKARIIGELSNQKSLKAWVKKLKY